MCLIAHYVLGGCTFKWNINTLKITPPPLFEEALDFLAHGRIIGRLRYWYVYSSSASQSRIAHSTLKSNTLPVFKEWLKTASSKGEITQSTMNTWIIEYTYVYMFYYLRA